MDAVHQILDYVDCFKISEDQAEPGSPQPFMSYQHHRNKEVVSPQKAWAMAQKKDSNHSYMAVEELRPGDTSSRLSI